MCEDREEEHVDHSEYDDADFDDEPESRVQCDKCKHHFDISETYHFGELSICYDCCQDKIDELVAERDQLLERIC